MRKCVMLLLSFLLLATNVPAYADTAATESSPAANESKAVKTADDFKDLREQSKDLKDKFNLFIREGALAPDSDELFGVDSIATREEFFRVAKVAFSRLTDKALTNNSYLEQFEKAGLINNEGIVYDGDDKMKRQDLAKFLIYGLGMVDAARKVTPITDQSPANLDGVDKTFSRFVTMALQLKIMKNQEDNRFHGDRMATRRMLVDALYETGKLFAELNAPGKVSLTEAKAVGAKKVSATFDRIVDSAKAKLTVKRDGSELAGTAEWSGDQKSAVITLEEKLKKGTYTVELSGLDEASVDKKSAEFTAEDEQIKAIEFVNPSDQLPRSKTVIEFKQKNQYGEQTEFTLGKFDIYTGRQPYKYFPNNKQAFILDLSGEKRGTQITVMVSDKERSLSATKTFKVGDKTLVSKVEAGDLIYEGNRQIIQPGQKVYLPFAAYDQYGNRIYDLDILKEGVRVMTAGARLFKDEDENVFFDYDGDGVEELELVADTEVDKDSSAELQLIALDSGQSVTKRLSVLTPKKPATVEISDPPSFLADGDVNKVITLIVRDAEGYQLTADEKAALAKAGEIRVTSKGGIDLESSVPGETGPIELSGGNRGDIRIKEVRGTAEGSIEVELRTNGFRTKADFDLVEKRKPVLLEKDGFEPSLEYMMTPGSSADFKSKVRDQYNDEYTITNNEYQVLYKLERVDGSPGAFTGEFSLGSTKLILNDQKPTLRLTAKDTTGKGVSLKADAKLKGTYHITATLVQVAEKSGEADPTKWPIVNELYSLTGKAKTYTWDELEDDDELTYWIDFDPNMFAYGKYFVEKGLKANPNKDDSKKTADAADAAYIFANNRDLTKEITNQVIRANNKEGTEVPFPKEGYRPVIKFVNIENTKIVAIDKTSSSTRIIGLNPGNTTAQIGFETPKGTKTLKINFSIYTSNIDFDYIKVGNNKAINANVNEIDGRYIWDGKLMNGVTVVDKSGNSFKNSADFSKNTNTENLTPFIGDFGVSLTLEDIAYKPGTKDEDKDTFYMTPDYKLVFKPKSGVYTASKVNLQSFKLRMVGPDNKPQETVVTVK
ncbi:hypothetical protein [Paenibacillus hamazuiensis]|uniref:hypothetical protein n=1 Tax=Paenibacillus hamazuiensis TaxID=2936508 RepID=UPI00200FAA77|nr:hypothetical protein [Paenibacillus hamazuiensis]